MASNSFHDITAQADNSINMKLLYPASHHIPRLSDSQLALKIARHSPCSECDTCEGLRPPPGVEVIPDVAKAESPLGNLEQYGSDDDDMVTDYLETCACGHGVQDHGADVSEIGTEEFRRRGRVAVRIDENLQVRFNILVLLHYSHPYPEIFRCPISCLFRESTAKRPIGRQ